MILEKKKLLFKTILVIFEDNKIENILKSGRYSSIIAISRKGMSLGIDKRVIWRGRQVYSLKILAGGRVYNFKISRCSGFNNQADIIIFN